MVEACLRYIEAGGLTYEDVQEALKEVRNRAGLARPKRGRKIPPRLTKAELSRFFAAISDPTDELALRVLYQTGARIAEFCAIEKAHIDFENCTIEIPAGKGNKRRWVPFPEHLKLAIRQQCARTKLYLFESAPGKPYSPRRWQQKIKAVAEQAGSTDEQLKKFSPHSFRHTIATEMLERGMPLQDVQKFLGHASAGTTDIYNHMNLKSLTERYQKEFAEIA